MQVCPAILTKDFKEFSSLLNKFSQITKNIDLDIIRPPFVDNLTLQVSEILNELEKYNSLNLGFDFMVMDPINDLELITKSKIAINNIRIYLHQEIDLNFLNNFDWPLNWKKCICLSVDTNLKEIDFYNRFDEIQFMTVYIGWQGTAWQPQVFNKIDKIRSEGYRGIISIDGSVNLNTAIEIKKHKIDRVSVGSYMVKSQNKKNDLIILEQVLNQNT